MAADLDTIVKKSVVRWFKDSGKFALSTYALSLRDAVFSIHENRSPTPLPLLEELVEDGVATRDGLATNFGQEALKHVFDLLNFCNAEL